MQTALTNAAVGGEADMVRARLSPLTRVILLVNACFMVRARSVTEDELIKGLDKLKSTMISVSTGGPQIGTVESQFVALYDQVDWELRARGIENGLPYRSLWDWYGRWSQGDLPSYQSRRTFVNDLFATLVKRVRDKPGQQYEPTGWARVDRTVAEMRSRL